MTLNSGSRTIPSKLVCSDAEMIAAVTVNENCRKTIKTSTLRTQHKLLKYHIVRDYRLSKLLVWLNGRTEFIPVVIRRKKRISYGHGEMEINYYLRRRK
ncbi:hypothetical protein TNCV_371221 [Trichonephila clavipes]|nr:hypothetical protein TNCV_371221 [Trichonephila clavipes]